MMKQLLQVIVRHSGTIALDFFLFAFIVSIYVLEGLWQGSGLHGYTFQPPAKGGPAYIVSTWTVFLQMITCLSLGTLFLFVALRRAGGVKVIFGLGRIELNQAGSAADQFGKNTQQRRRKRTKHQ